MCLFVGAAPDRGEELGPREAGSFREVQSRESSVGAEAERGHRAAQGTIIYVQVGLFYSTFSPATESENKAV